MMTAVSPISERSPENKPDQTCGLRELRPGQKEQPAGLLEGKDNHNKRLAKCFPDENNAVVDFARLNGVLNDSVVTINTQFDGGLTVLHEAACRWMKEVSRRLIEDLGADPKVADHSGRTPLHFAAAADDDELCKLLIEKGVDKEATTNTDEQTPLFYAARNNAVKALKYLISIECEFKDIRDYRGRSPLAVAAEFGCVGSARVLLKKGAPADAADDCNQLALVPMIMNIPEVAQLALDKFYEDLKTGQRLFYLDKLEKSRHSPGQCIPRCSNTSKDKTYKSPLQMIVEERDYELVRHPVIVELIRRRWEAFRRMETFRKIVFDICFCVWWYIMVLVNKITSKAEVFLPEVSFQSGWIIALYIATVVFVVLEICLEVREICRSHADFRTWKKHANENIEKDETYCTKNLMEWSKLQRCKKIVAGQWSSYGRDHWNILEIICIVLCLISLILYGVSAGVNDERLRLALFWFIVLATFAVGVRALLLLRWSYYIGHYVVMFGHLLKHFLPYAFIFIVIYFCFVFAFYAMLGCVRTVGIRQAIGSSGSYKTPQSANGTYVVGFENFSNTMFTVFRIAIGDDDYDLNEMDRASGYSSKALMVFWKVVSLILLTNVLIALLSDIVSHIFTHMWEYVTMERAILIIAEMDDAKSESNSKLVVHEDGDTQRNLPGSSTDPYYFESWKELRSLRSKMDKRWKKIDEELRKIHEVLPKEPKSGDQQPQNQ